MKGGRVVDQVEREAGRSQVELIVGPALFHDDDADLAWSAWIAAFGVGGGSKTPPRARQRANWLE